MSLQHIWLILGLGKEKESGIFLFSKGKWCWTIVNPGGKKKNWKIKQLIYLFPKSFQGYFEFKIIQMNLVWVPTQFSFSLTEDLLNFLICSTIRHKRIFLFFLIFFFFGVQLITILLVSAVSKMNHLYIYIFPLFFGFPFHLGHHRELSRLPCAIQSYH